MTVMAIYRRNDISAELYDKFRARLPLDAAPPGALVHSYGRNGPGFVTVDIWEDRPALERFIRDRLIPATEAVGVRFEWPEIIEVETFRTTSTAQKHLLAFEPAVPA